MRFYNNGIYQPYKTDLETLNLKKSKTNHDCKMCNKEIPKGSFCWGGNRYWRAKVCLNCAELFFNNAIGSVTNFLNMIKRVKKDLDKNKSKYKLNNSVANI